MKIDCIFEIIENSLAAVKYVEEPSDSFEYCFELWDDVEYLEKYFEQNKALLATDFWRMDLNDAVFKVLNEAKKFREDILYCAEHGKTKGAPRLDNTIFRSLHRDVLSNIRIPSKAYGSEEENSFLRIYAIRLGPNEYVVTGGAIKLTKEMQAHEDTALELLKLEQVSVYLRGLGINEAEDYGYIEFENKE